MLYSLSGKLAVRKPSLVVLETNGIGFKIFVSSRNFRKLPKTGSKIKLFCYPYIRQDGMELYGFLTEKELEIFELLNSINNVGPKIALRILNVLSPEKFLTIVDKNRIDLLVKISQVGKKTAQRIILELRDKIKNLGDKKNEALDFLETDLDIESALKNLGYQKNEIKEALERISPKIKKIEERLKMALKFLACFLFLILLGISSTSALAASPLDLKESITQKAQELFKIQSQIQGVQKDLEETKEESRSLKKEVSQVNNQLNQISLGIKASGILIEKLSLEIESLGYEVSEIEGKIGMNKEAIAQTLRELQIKDNETPLIIFLKNKSLADSVFEMQGLSDLGNQLTEEVDKMQTLKTQLNEKLEDSSAKKRSKETENLNLKNKKVISEDIKEEKVFLLEKTKNQEKKYQEMIEELKKSQAEIAEEIDRLEEELRLKIDPSALPAPRPGVLAIPVARPPAILTQEYGSTTFVRRQGRRWHNGVDFGGPIGTPIFSAEKGEVIAVGDQDNYRVNGRRTCYKAAYGKFVMVKFENNLTALYAHLSRWIVKIGDKVEQDQIIGYMGNTGRSTGPHLHFTVYATQTIPPATPGFPEGTRSSSLCGPLPIGGDLDPLQYLNI